MITVTRWEPLEVLVQVEQGDDFQIPLNPAPWPSSICYPCPQCAPVQTVPDTTGSTFLLTIDAPHYFPLGPLYSSQVAGGPEPVIWAVPGYSPSGWPTFPCGKARLEVKQWGTVGTRDTVMTGVVMVKPSLSCVEGPAPVNPLLFIDGAFWATVEPIMVSAPNPGDLLFDLTSGQPVAAFFGSYSGPRSGTIRYAFAANGIGLAAGLYSVTSTSPDGQWSVSGTLIVSETVELTPQDLVASEWSIMEPAFAAAQTGASVIFTLQSGAPAVATFTGTFSGPISGSVYYPWPASDVAILPGTYSVTSTSPDGKWSVSGQVVVT